MIKVDVSVKNVMYVKDYILNRLYCENGKYLGRIMDDSAIMFDEVIVSYNEDTKTVPTNFNEKI